MRHVLEVDAAWLDMYKPPKQLKPSDCYRLTQREPPAALVAAETSAVAAMDVGDAPRLVKVEPVKVTDDAVSAARARYLARKQQQPK